VHEAARIGVDDHQRQLGRAGGDAGEAQGRPRLRAVAREARRDRAVGREVGARDRELARRRRGRSLQLVAPAAAGEADQERDGRAAHDWHDGAPMRLFALRGATTVDVNDSPAILGATEELMREIMARNAIGPADVVSCIFTLTDDLDADFPAVAARRLGFDRVPLLCAREVPVPGALGHVIRVLIHYYADEAHRATHVYLGGARALRTDLESAQ
jgi:chorismate mutase